MLNIEYERGHGTLGPVMRGLRTINCRVADLALDDDDDECSGGAGLRRARLAIQVADESALFGFVRMVHRRPEVVTVSVGPPAAVVPAGAPDIATPMAEASTEVELQYRYRGAPREVVPIELAGLPLTRSKRVELVDTYFDTEQLALRRAHCSLRIRREGDRPARLVWKGPPRHRPDGAKLATTGLADLVAGLLGPGAWAEIRSIGDLRNERSVHTYGANGQSLELVWDRLEYPTGPAETRLEVEAANAESVELLALADEQLRKVLGRDLETSPRGKARELCARLQAVS